MTPLFHDSLFHDLILFHDPAPSMQIDALLDRTPKPLANPPGLDRLRDAKRAAAEWLRKAEVRAHSKFCCVCVQSLVGSTACTARTAVSSIF